MEKRRGKKKADPTADVLADIKLAEKQVVRNGG